MIESTVFEVKNNYENSLIYFFVFNKEEKEKTEKFIKKNTFVHNFTHYCMDKKHY